MGDIPAKFLEGLGREVDEAIKEMAHAENITKTISRGENPASAFTKAAMNSRGIPLGDAIAEYSQQEKIPQKIKPGKVTTHEICPKEFAERITRSEESRSRR